MKSNPPTLTLRVLIFGANMFLSTLVCSIISGTTVADQLYNCTDPASGVLDYWFPGDWVHGKFQYVSEVHTGRPMNEPDTIKQGWSRFGLWSLWLTMVGESLVVSFALERNFAQAR